MTLLTIAEQLAEFRAFQVQQLVFMALYLCCFAIAVGASVWLIFSKKGRGE